MKTTYTKTVLQGQLRENPWGNWSDVDKGLFVGSDKIESSLWDLVGKNVKITIEEIDEDVDENE